MNFKFLALGLVAGFVIATAQSCGASSQCTASNCAGCCTSSGTCIARTAVTDSQCGSGGLACVDCANSSQTCNKDTFQCVARVGDAGTGGTTDAGTQQTVDAGPGTCNFPLQQCAAGSACMLVVPPDPVNHAECRAGTCDLVKQNCLSASETCDYTGSSTASARGCITAGTVTEGQTCPGMGGAGCVKGQTCVDGKCTKYCYSNADCSAGGTCDTMLLIPGTNERPLVCQYYERCNPLVQMCTKGTDSCYPTNAGPICLPTGTGAMNATCGAQATCGRGLVCLFASANAPSGNCKTVCNLDAGMPACASGACQKLPNENAFGLCP